MKKQLCILFSVLLCIFLLAACGTSEGGYDNDYRPNSMNRLETTEDRVDPTEQPEDLPFEMELVGKSNTRDVTFLYYRETTTDLLYLYASGVGGRSGFTIMSDPSTGLPLTYTRYLEIYDSLDHSPSQ